VVDIWEMLTEANAEIFGAETYGLREDGEGSLVVYDSPDGFNTLRTRAPRTLVVREGDPIARTAPVETDVLREDGSKRIDFHR